MQSIEKAVSAEDVLRNRGEAGTTQTDLREMNESSPTGRVKARSGETVRNH